MAEKQNDLIKKYSVWKSVMFPLRQLADNFEKFLLSGCLFALILTMLSYLFDQTYICVFNKALAQYLPCYDHNSLYGIYLLLKLIVCSFFVTVWIYLSTRETAEDDVYEYFLNHKKKFLLDFLIIVVFFVISLIPAVSGILLLMREPNPVWQIELLYFTFIGLGFVVPFVLMRFFTIFAELLAGEKWQNFVVVWRNTSGNVFKIVVSTALIFVIVLFLLVSINTSFRAESTSQPQLYNFAAEFVFNLITLLIVALFVSFIQGQKVLVLDNK